MTPAVGLGYSYTGMVSFGDSRSDVGNTISLLSETQARELTGYNPSFYFNNRYSNGPLWIDHLSNALGFPAGGSMQRNDGGSVITGTNFAWAEARSGTGNNPGAVPVPNLLRQVGFYTDQLAASNPALSAPATTLFTLWSGANDVLAHVDAGDSITPTDVALNLATAITDLHQAGGRDFLVLNLPPIGLSPKYLNDPEKGPLATAFTNAFNAQLDLTLNGLASTLSGSRLIKLDVHQIFLDAINAPASFGFSNVTDAAYELEPGPNPPPPYGSVVGNPENYLFWDSVHGASSINMLIGQAAFAQIQVVPEPATWGLFLGIALVALCVARKRRAVP